MAANVLNIFNNKRPSRLLADMVQQLCDGGQMPAGKYVMINEAKQGVSMFLPRLGGPI